MGTEEDLTNISLPALHWVLAKRLKHSRTWDNVKVSTTKKVFRIKWMEPKKPDPDGKKTFKIQERPYSLKSMDDEITRQMKKYLIEIGEIQPEVPQ